MQTAIPCVLMRGGTSKGPYFHASDLPADRDGIARVLMAAMGSPDARQIDGIGGADFVTSKVAIVSPSDRDDADVNYLFLKFRSKTTSLILILPAAIFCQALVRSPSRLVW